MAELEAKLPGLSREQQLQRLRWVTGQVAVQAGIKAGTRVLVPQTDFRKDAVAKPQDVTPGPNLFDQVLIGAAVVAVMAPKLIRLEAVLKQDDPQQILAVLKDLVNDLPASGGLVITA